jgi:hypothetical protein
MLGFGERAATEGRPYSCLFKDLYLLRKANYSFRNAVEGLTFVARHAGI